MKIQDLRELLKKADREHLEKAFAECYKQFSRSKKEEIDVLIGDVLSGEDSKKAGGRKPVDFEELKRQISLFVENANAQNYLVPNRSIPKNQRSKWRFLVMNFIKELEKIQPESEFYEQSVQCLWDLYGVLCKGCNVYLFSSDDPFASVRWEQPKLFHLLVKKTFQNGYDREKLKKAILLSSTGGLSRTSLYVMNQLALLSELKTSDVKYMAIEETKKLIEDGRSEPIKKNDYSASAYYRREKNDNLCELVLLISISLAETDTGIRYFFSKCLETDKEIALYRALDCASWMEDDQAWIDIYHYGLAKKIKPRDSLQEQYKELISKK